MNFKSFFVTLFICHQFLSFDLKQTRFDFYSSNQNKEKDAEILRDYYLDEAPDSIFNVGKHLIDQGIKFENVSWNMYGKLLLSSFYNKKGKTDFSIPFLKECIAFYERKKDYFRLADSYNQLGQAYYFQTKYKEAIKYFKQSLSTASLLPIEEEAFTAHLTLTETYFALNKLDEAEKEIKLFLEKAKKLQLNKALRKGYGILAKIYIQKDRKTEAIQYFQKALKLAYQNGDKLGLSTAYNNIAIAFFETNEIEKAKFYFERSLKLRLEINYPTTICESYYNLAEINLYIGNEQIAIDFLKKNIDLAKKSNLVNEEVDAYERLVSIFEEKHDLRQAFVYSKELVSAQKGQLKLSYELESELDDSHQQFVLKEQQLLQKQRERKLTERVVDAQNQKMYTLICSLLFALLMIGLFWKFSYSSKDKSTGNEELRP